MIFEHLSRRSNETFDPDKFVPVENELWRSLKPKHGTGLWACPVSLYPRSRFVMQNDHGIDVCRFDEDIVLSSFHFKLANDSNLLVIRDDQDIEGLPTKENMLSLGLLSDNLMNVFPGLDWEVLAEDHGAVLVDTPILYDNRFRGWDVPSLVVLQASAVVVADNVEVKALQLAN